MKIFISYASEHRSVADSINVKLRGEGHTVFFDKDDLPPAQSYDASIRQAITDCDLFIFLISPESIAKNAYALTELGFARDKWKSPVGHVLPVIVSETKMEDMPVYLSAVSILTPQGNLVAEVLAEVARRRPRMTKSMILGGGALAIVLVLGALVLLSEKDLVPGKKAVPALCHLSFTLRSPNLLDENHPRSLVQARVNVKGVTNAFPLSREGGNPVDVSLGVNEPWAIEVVDSQKVIVGPVNMRGCPSSVMEKDFDGDIHLSIKPR